MSAAVILFAVACGLGLALTYVVRGAAYRFEFTDRPDGHRKVHTRTTALGGGLAVFLATVGTIGLACLLHDTWRGMLLQNFWTVAGFGAAGSIVVVVGLLDDWVGLRGRQKLLGQFVAAGVLVASGLSIQRIQLFDWTVDLGLLAIPFTMFWLLGAINAINLMDGIDGLAASMGIILSGAIAVMAVIANHPQVAAVAIVFMGALLGFLRFNFPPATIFLGDAGSMLIGLMMGGLAIHSSLKGPGTVLLAAPLALWVVPIFDSAAAILRRKLTGRSLYATDRAHLHHCLNRQFGNRKALAWIALACILACGGALVSVFSKSDLVALVSSAALVSMFVVSRIFGHSELLLLASRLKSAGRSLVTFRRSNGADHPGWQSTVRLQGNREWEILWAGLVEWCDKLHLEQIHLDVNLPMLHEGYNAAWRRTTDVKFERCWQIEMPLVLSGSSCGSLRVVGERNGLSARRSMEQLLELLETFEEQLSSLATDAVDEDSAHREPSGNRGIGAPVGVGKAE